MSLRAAGREARRVIAMQFWAALLVLLCTGCDDPEYDRIVVSVQSDGPYPADTSPAAPRTTGAVAVRSLRSFQLMEEKDTSSTLFMHVPWGWTKLSLLFTTADRRGYVILQDDGSGVTIEVRVSSCNLFSRYYQYDETPDQSHLYDAMASDFRNATRGCRQRIEKADEYEREFRLARGDFPAAIGAMKARAVVLFHTLAPRCQTPEPQDDGPVETNPNCA